MDTTTAVSHPLAAGPAGAVSSVFSRISPRTRGLLALGFALLAGLVTATWLWSSAPTYRVLFTNLSDRDGGAVIAQLAQMNVPYRTGDGGTVLVPADQVHEARLRLASQGLPKGSVVGFELLESQKFGATQFQEQVAYQRGLEGELARSIATLGPVAAARVHLALPKSSGFLRDKQPPTASVVVQVHPGKALDRQQIAGIVHLVSSSVPELSPKGVSVVDQTGALLSQQRENAAGLDAAQLDYVAQVEAATIKRIEDILSPIVGPGNVRAQVTADVDFAQSENVAETYRPNGNPQEAAVRSSSVSESAQPGPATPQGVPGALSNQPPVPATAPINGTAAPLNANQPGTAAGSSTRREALTNYEIDKQVRHTRVGAGQIRRLSAAVVVNLKPAPAAAPPAAGTAAAPPAAAPAPQPYSDKEMQDLQALVREAMGFNTQRGDSVNVVAAAFTATDLVAPAPLPPWQQPDVVALAKEVGKAALLLLLTLIVVFGVLRPALRQIGVREKPAAGSAPAADGAVPALPAAANPAAPALPSPMDEMRRIAKDDPAAVANVVKAWVAEAK